MQNPSNSPEREISSKAADLDQAGHDKNELKKIQIGADKVGFVVIGRNEGDRLKRCLNSIRIIMDDDLSSMVYVDSGSSDDSVVFAKSLGAHVITLDMSIPFTAARARNAGYAALRKKGGSLSFIQFIDGDCALDPDWLPRAVDFLQAEKEVAAVCGRRRELFPQTSLYNRMCDHEWETPIGETYACGGDVLFRAKAFDAVNGFNELLIAGEEPELCLRLREKDWIIYRLDAEMTTHDAAILRFSEWWLRAKRGGHAFAEISSLHRRSNYRIWQKETRRALIWSGFAIMAGFISLLFFPYGLALFLVYPLQVMRLANRNMEQGREDAMSAAFLSVMSKFAETSGIIKFWVSKLSGRDKTLIEYKNNNEASS